MLKSSLTPPTVDQATIDRYVAKARRERSRAIISVLRNLFSAPGNVTEAAPKPILSKADCTA